MRFNLACFVIRSEGHLIAVDTGLGPKPTPKLPWGELLNDFSAHGMNPEDVDMVVMTHAHRDHVGWNVVSQDGKYVPTFPNARYYVSARDWEACHDPDLIEARFPNAPECVWPLEDLGVLELMEGEHQLTSELSMLPTPGHTPGHMSINITSQGERGLVLGDVLHNTVQIENTDWVSRADIDPGHHPRHPSQPDGAPGSGGHPSGRRAPGVPGLRPHRPHRGATLLAGHLVRARQHGMTDRKE